METDVAEVIADEAAETAAEVGGVAGAIAGAGAAESAAREAVEEVAEEIGELVEEVRETVTEQEGDLQWERMRGLLLEQEARIVSGVSTAILGALTAPTLALEESESFPTTLETAPTLEEAATELAEEAEQIEPGVETIELDPLAELPASASEAAGRRRPRGLGRRRST